MFLERHGMTLMEKIYLDNRNFLPLPQHNVVSRIKNLGQYCKGRWGNLVHFLGTCPIFFSHDCLKFEKKQKKKNREGTSYASQKFEILMFTMHIIIHLMTTKSNDAYPNF